MRAAISFTLRRPGLVLAGVAVATAFLGVVAARGLDVDNTIDVWLPSGDAELARYRDFRDVFGEDSFALVTVDDFDRDDGTDRSAADALRVQLEAIPGMAAVRDANDAGAASAAAGPDRGEFLALFVQPDEELPADERSRLVGRVDAAVAASPLADRAHIAGPEAINYYLDRGSRESFGRFFPLVVGLAGAALLALLRDVRQVVGILLLAGVSSITVLGAMALTGRSLNMVVSAVPALLLVLGTAHSLHVVTAFAAASGTHARERWRRALAETVRPCALAALTTAAGLCALATAELPPVRDLGLFGALGALTSFALTFTFLPAFLLSTGAQGGATSAVHGLSWLPEARTLLRLRRAILGATLAVAVLSVAGVARLRVESHILSFFPSDHELVRATAAIEERDVGLTPIEVWFEGPGSMLSSAQVAASAGELARSLKREPDVTGIFGPLASPATAAALALDGQVRSHLRVNGDQVDARWTIAARTTSIEESAALLDRVEREVGASLPDEVEGRVTGAVPILVRIQAALLTTQIRTFGAAMGVVTLILSVAFRSIRLALLSLVPNLLPVTMTLGLMGFSGLPLDVATVTVASIALGLVVDDTIHFLEHYARKRGGGDATARLDRVLRERGRPILFTSLVTAAGFAAFAAAPFRPTRDFGLLVAATALFALACDLLVLPAILLCRRGGTA